MGSTSFPFSEAFDMSYTERIIAHQMKTEASAKCMPGQILVTKQGRVRSGDNSVQNNPPSSVPKADIVDVGTIVSPWFTCFCHMSHRVEYFGIRVRLGIMEYSPEA